MFQGPAIVHADSLSHCHDSLEHLNRTVTHPPSVRMLIATPVLFQLSQVNVCSVFRSYGKARQGHFICIASFMHKTTQSASQEHRKEKYNHKKT